MEPQFGREIGALDDLLAHVTERGAAGVVRGEDGVGKFSLLAAARARAQARGMLVLTTTGVQLDRLSPQELQIAQMAAEGLSNRDIGQRLYLSYRTVGFHLYRIFPKLGITARSELRAALENKIAS